MEEKNVLFLKSKINALPGFLILQADVLKLTAHKQTINLGGLLGAFLKKKVEEKDQGFEWNVNDIVSISKGKHGVQSNVLELKHKNGEEFRILVKNYDVWHSAILEKKAQ